ncbi:hypothetical protein OVA24_16485 [Luteolibacter sp. SL250]|uniref:MuF-C-terminal domain-containing protein n=1 Tax=Luteolibacter sp. SL250 TaxID=2995170 RepID=UPI0022713D66|nr:hypothetical protein [Luteolibacter sp. SL250]WAC18829.1 hypothetical protein OVA24_16485 [Luteolibacter sp. SL250]
MNVQELPLSLPSTTGTPFPAPRGPRLRNEGALYAPEDLTAPPQPPPLLSPEEEARARGERTYNQVTDWNDMLSGEDGFRKVAERRGFLRDYLDAAGGAAGGEELRGRLTRNVFIQDLTGASPEQLVGGVPQLQLAGVMGLPDGDDATFDAKMKELVGREMNYRRNWEKVYQIGNRAALRGTPWADAKKEAEALAGTDWKLFQPLFDKGFTDVYSQFSQEDLELIDHGWRTVSMLDWREYQEEPDPETFNKAFERYGRMTQAERMKILGSIQLRAASEGEDLAKLPERFGQAMLYRGTALITRLNSAQGREAADGLLELAHSSGKVLLNTPVITEKYLRDNGGSITTEDASDVGRLELSADVHEFSTAEQLRSGVRVTGTKYRNLGEDEKEAITRYAYWLRGISAFMLGIQHHNIQAARFRDNEFTGNRGIFLDLLVAAGESIPAMGATAIPYGVGLPLTLTSYAEDELYRLQAENPAADPEVLERAAYANGALKVGLDRLELGILRARMPRFSAFAMNRGKLIGVPMVAGGRLLANGTFQTVQEVAQDAMDPLVQAATAAIAEDVQMPDLGKWMEREKEAVGEIAGVSFLLSFAGAAGTTAVDYIQAPALRASLMDASGLRLAGIPEVEAARISAMAESHPAAAAQLLHATMRDTPAAARREISRAEAERLELGWLNAGMREAGLPEILRDGEGGVFVRYHDDATADRAFPTLEDAAREVDSHLQGRDVDLTRLNRQLFDLLSRSYGSLGDLELDGTVKPGRISLADIVSRDPAMLETARQRARIHFRQAEADMGLAHATDGTIDSHLASLFVLGSSRNEFAGGVTRIVAEIAGNASPLTVLEESIEGVGKYLMDRRGVSRGKMLRWIRETEAGTRTHILARDFDTLDEARQYQELIEGWSRIGVAHATGRMRDSQLAGPLRSFFRALREVLGQVLRLAAAMRHHAASGKMDAEMRHWLDVAAGFTPEVDPAGHPGGKNGGPVGMDAAPVLDPASSAVPSFALSPESATAKKFRSDVDAILGGSYDNGRPVTMGATPAVLRAVGANPLLLVMPASVVTKATGGKHDLSPEQLKEVVTQIHDPLFVFESETVPDALTVILDLKHKGENLLVAVHLDKKMDRFPVNSIASVYAKSNPAAIAQWMKDGTLRYIHSQRGREWFQSRGLQLPKEGSTRGNPNLITEADIVKGGGGGQTSFSLGPAPSLIRPLDPSTHTDQNEHHERLREPLQILEALGAETQGHGQGGLRTNAGKRRKHGREVASGPRLAIWAQENGRNLIPEPFGSAVDLIPTGGGEHKVLYDEESQRVIKLTKPGLFGVQAEDAIAYLERWALHNRAFGDDVAFEGLVTLPGEHAPRAVISQRYAEGRDATMEEQADFLNGKGFHEQPDGRWIHPIRGITVWDTVTPGNVIATADGMRVIDLQVAPTPSKELAEVRQFTGIGRETSFSIGNDPNQPHDQQHDQEGRMVSGNGAEQDIPGGSEAESRRRIRETLARRERGEGEGDLGDGAESVVIAIDDDEVLKDIRRSGVICFNSDGDFTNDRSFDAAEEKALIINALGGMKTRVISLEGRMLFIQERGTPITETEYLSVELPFGIEPTRHGTYKIRIDGDEYLIADLKPENFVKDPQGNIRLIDLITGKVAKGSTPK